MAVRNRESERVAAAIREEMIERGITRKDLADGIERVTGKRPGRQWLSRTLSGGSHLTVQRPTEVPNDLLTQIAAAIEPHPERARRLARRLGKAVTETE